MSVQCMLSLSNHLLNICQLWQDIHATFMRGLSINLSRCGHSTLRVSRNKTLTHKHCLKYQLDGC